MKLILIFSWSCDLNTVAPINKYTPCKIKLLLSSRDDWIFDVNTDGPHFGTVLLKSIYINHRE